MTVLALKLSRRANAVSALHGQVSRAMWTGSIRARARSEVPIGHITNGVHVPAWLAPQMHRLYDRHLGADWPQRCGEPASWEAIEQVDDGELWETHSDAEDAADRVRAAAGDRGGEPPRRARGGGRSGAAARSSLDALTIGFARRFATYKRADLVLRDLERIAALVNDPQRPVQFVFAGKAHPHDDARQGHPARASRA